MTNHPVAGVYSIVNTISNRTYVGSSVDIKGRWQTHQHRLRQNTHHSKLLQRSWNKYGEGAFVFTILELVDPIDALRIREQHWMVKLKAICPKRGFNTNPRSDNSLGFQHTSETKAILSKLRKGQPKSPEHAAKLRAILTERNRSLEMRNITSARNKAATTSFLTIWNKTPEAKAITAARNKTPEMRLAVSASKRGRPRSPETKNKLRVKRSAEARQRMREAWKIRRQRTITS